MTAAFEEGTRAFHSEKAHGLHASKLKVSVWAV
jgi:hypothetical protein